MPFAVRCPPFIATGLTALALVLLCGLGTWQIHRLGWKQDILRALEAEYATPLRVLTPAETDGDFMFRRGRLSGTYRYDKQVLVGPRAHDSQPGFHVLTPLRLADGSYVIVDRGWVPQGWRDAHTGTKRAKISGLLRKPPARNPFTPANDPARGIWYYPDPQEIAAAGKLAPVRPYILYRESENDREAYPLPDDSRPRLANNHQLYAMFWFSLAVALLIIYILRFVREERA